MLTLVEGQAFPREDRLNCISVVREGKLFTEETEAPKGEIIRPRLCRWEVADLESKRVLADAVALCPAAGLASLIWDRNPGVGGGVN